MHRTDHMRPQTIPLLPLALLALIPIALLAFGIAGIADNVRDRTHASAKHGEQEVNAIHRCLENNGPAHIFRSRSWRTPNKYYMTCELSDGRWGLSILQKTSKGYLEKTAYIVKDGSLKSLIEWVTARAELVSGILP